MSLNIFTIYYEKIIKKIIKNERLSKNTQIYGFRKKLLYINYLIY